MTEICIWFRLCLCVGRMLAVWGIGILLIGLVCLGVWPGGEVEMEIEREAVAMGGEEPYLSDGAWWVV